MRGLESIPGVVQVVILRGSECGPEVEPSLLVEVPHGADTQAHYDAVATRLRSPLPDRLDRFFHVNTDVAAWAIGLTTAAHYIDQVPTAAALALRCEIPRTFIDVNRVIGRRMTAGLTPGLQPWVTDPADVAWLTQMHERYTDRVGAAYERVCGAGGRALIPHTYAPRSVPITQIDAHIIEELDRVYQPEVLRQAPLRSEIDLITTTPEGVDLAPPGLAAAVTQRLSGFGYTVEHNHAYELHPVTMGAKWSSQWPGSVLCLEVRRDLVTHWEPFVSKTLRSKAIDGIAQCIALSLL